MPSHRLASEEEEEQVQPNTAEDPTEETPLLSREEDEYHDDDEEAAADTRHANHNDTSYVPSASRLLRRLRGDGAKKGILKRWPSLLALLILIIVIIIILIFAFFTPQIIKEYSAQAIQFEPASLWITDINEAGVVARIKGNFNMDASRVKNKNVRNLGRFSTWIAREVEIKPTNVSVSFPDYNDLLAGIAELPKIKVNVRNKHVTALDVETKLKPESKKAMRRVADDWIKGKLSQLKVDVEADVSLKSGIFKFPKQNLNESLVFKASDVPSVPDYKIRKIDVHETDLPDGNTGLAANALITIYNDYPVDFTIPSLGFAIFMPNCEPSDPHIMLGDAITAPLHIQPEKDITLNVTGYIRRLPDEALISCPDTRKTPLDLLLGSYMHGNETTIYVQGSDSQSQDSPKWLIDIMKDITVPVMFPGSSLDDLIKDFTLQDTHFDLPDLFADPNSPDSKVKLSGNILALIDLPAEINFPIDAHRLRGNTSLYYHHDKFAHLDLSKWQTSTSKLVNDGDDLEVKSVVDKAPLSITDTGVFSIVLQEIISGNKKINLTAKANLDVDIETALGRLVVRDVPAKGEVPVNTLGGHNSSSFAPRVHNILIVDTTPDSISLAASANFTNPTPYSATVPFVDVKLAVNGTVIGHASARNISLRHGENTVDAKIFWDPRKESGHNGTLIAREMLSQYLSGYNVSLTIKTHKDTLPNLPDLNEALSRLNITVPLPHLGDDDGDGNDPDDKSPHFIRGTTMHILSSTATFTLHSPFKQTTIHLTSINATAFYKSNEVGRIEYPPPPLTKQVKSRGKATDQDEKQDAQGEDEIPIPPGTSETPRLPVAWRLGAGFDAIKKALGGNLKLDAVADVGVRIGKWREMIWFEGKGIGTDITFL